MNRYAHWITAAAAALLLAGIAGADTVTVTFDNGLEGWVGPSGPGGSTVIDPDGGNPGANLHTVFNNFGIEFRNATNSDFVQDYTQYLSVTISVDVKVNDISFFGSSVPRPFLLDLRDYDLGDPGYPWASVWFDFGDISEATHGEWTTLSATIANPQATELPDGWGGTGSENDQAMPVLPEGVTFAQVLAGLDEVAFSTFKPGYVFGFTDFDVQIDNISITTVIPAPASLALLAVAGIAGRRRRRIR